MKKAFDQTVRDLKREMNKKVLKVPSVEQKVLDATSNESWGPHGTLLADIAQASRNYQEYQIIMAVMWKRINDTGKNWRHVYKALTVLEYLVAHGSERVIDEIREHAYQIQTLSDFQYIDSSGRDQGSNVRKKSQSLVVLVNDKERIQEVRQKAATNRDKFRNTSMSSVYRPGSHSSSGGYGDRYDDDRYGSRDDDRNGYGKERDGGYRDDDRYGRYGDPYGRDGDRHAREYEERYSRDDEYRGRSRNVDDNQYGSRSRSSDRDRDRAYEDDGQYSSRGSGAKADDQSQDGSFSGTRPDQKYSEQNPGAPPSYEEAVSAARSPTLSERDGETSSATAPKPSSPPASASPTQAPGAAALPPLPASASPTQATSAAAPPPAPASQPAPAVGNNEADGFDEFDPRGSFFAAPTTSSGAATTSGGAEMDFLGSLSESFTANSLALVPATSVTTSEADPLTNIASGPTYAATTSASSDPNQGFDDPFGDGPFRAIPSTDGVPGQQQNYNSITSFQPASNQGPELLHQVSHNAENISTSVETFHGATYTPFGASDAPLPSTNTQYSQQELSTSDQSIDILADILPPTGPQQLANSQAGYPAPISQPVSQTAFPPQTGQNVSQTTLQSQSGANAHQTGFSGQPGQPASLTGFPAQSGQLMMQTSFPTQSNQPVSQAGFPAQSGQPQSLTGFPAQSGQPQSLTGFQAQAAQASQTGFPAQIAQPASISGFPSQVGQAGFQTLPSGQSAQPNAVSYGNYNLQPGSAAPVGQMAPQVSAGPTAQHNAINFLTQSASGVPVGSHMALSAAQVGSSVPVSSQPALPASTGSLAIATPPARDKFETKSTVWTDTLSRGLVNLNISGPKINPLSDIGIDFDALNRKEKRMEKPAAAPVTSTITMGKAMGAGTGVGRAGAGALRPSPNPMMGAGMGMGMAGPRPGIGMGGYGGMSQPGGVGMGMNMPSNMGMGMNMPSNMGMGMNMPSNMGMGMNMPSNMGMGMNMGMGGQMQQPMNMGMGGQMQQPTGFPPGSTMPGGYNPMMGTGNYNQQQYGGGYR